MSAWLPQSPTVTGPAPSFSNEEKAGSAATAARKLSWALFVGNERYFQVVIATLYLKRQDGVFRYGPRETPWFHRGREVGAVGSLATGRIVVGDWSCVWQAIVLDRYPYIAARRDPSGVAASFSVGLDAV